jgi:RNA polymerase sigma-70 factor (sigma-E family)
MMMSEVSIDGEGARAVPAVYAADRRRELHDLYQAHYVGLVRLAALVLGSRESAEEVVQDAFVKLDSSWDRIDDPTRTPAYLRSIVMNLARSRLRRRVLARRHRPAGPSHAPGSDVAAVSRDDQRRVVEALQTLPTRQRQCLVLRYYAELSEAEIAETLGISPGTVKSSTHRAMKSLAQRLEEW